MDRILLFIPGYNCEKQIVRVLGQLKGEILHYITEIIMVNNRSTDDTEDAVIEYAKNHPELDIKLLRNDLNYGLGGSHKVAFDYAINNNFDYVIVLHGDDQGSISDLLPVLKAGKHKRHDCCLGARFHKDSKLVGYSSFRTFGNRVYNILFSMVVGRSIKDLGSGLNMYDVNMLKSKFYIHYPDNLTFNYCMVMALRAYSQDALFFPIVWREEDQVSNVKMMSQATSVLKMLFSYFFKRKKYLESDLRARQIAAYTAKQVYPESEDAK